jgi:hypothetical protein
MRLPHSLRFATNIQKVFNQMKPRRHTSERRVYIEENTTHIGRGIQYAQCHLGEP